MNHLSEEQLILHHYDGETDRCEAERHLEECGECREARASLERVLRTVTNLPVPERSAAYGARVWARVEPYLPAPRTNWPALYWRWALAGAAFACLLVAAFLAGRLYPIPAPVPPRVADSQATERILLLAVGDYLERAQRVLIELANASPKAPLDIADEQQRAGDLVADSRLYRQTAEHTGDFATANVLDEVDRMLLDIAHSPAELSAGELETLRERLKAEEILFKIRVLESNVRNRAHAVSYGDPQPPKKL